MGISEDGEAIRSRLRHFRRRAFAAGFLGVVPFCAALSFAALVAWAFLFEDGELTLIPFAAGLLAALAAAILRARSLAGTARSVDRKAGLEQRLETAVELMEDPGPVAALILRDARRVTEEVRGRDVFPLRLGTGRGTRGAFAFLTLVLLGAAFSQRDGRPGRPFRLVPAAGVPGNAELRELEVAPRVSGGETTAPAEPAGNIEPGVSAAAPSSPESARRPDTTTSPNPVDFAAGVEGPKARAGTIDSPGGETREWMALESPLGRGLGDQSTASGRAETSVAGPSGEVGAGGEGTAVDLASSSSDSSSEFGDAGGTNEESPSPLDRVPPGLRDYVREYFVRLRNPR